MTGDTWSPGMNTPFDPTAAQHASKIGMTVISTAGKDLQNLKSILEDGSYVGTTIVPDQAV